MTLFYWGVVALLASTVIVIWDLGSKRARGATDPYDNWVQGAWLVMTISGFGLMLKITGFSEILLSASILTGLVVLWDAMRRHRLGPEIVYREGPWVELSKSFFPVILAVFLVRSFLYEPFKIPSGSMIPTLMVGDFILVSKYSFGLRLPITNQVVVPVGEPQRGDVMVFKYPADPSTNYIKRTVGLPGDTVSYRDKRLFINGQAVPLEPAGTYDDAEEPLGESSFLKLTEQLGQHRHDILVMETQPPVLLSEVRHFPDRDACTYDLDGFTCKVPAGHYLMMGDNRDRSSDSRYWGFVPERDIVGKALLVWMNFQEPHRIGTLIH